MARAKAMQVQVTEQELAALKGEVATAVASGQARNLVTSSRMESIGKKGGKGKHRGNVPVGTTGEPAIGGEEQQTKDEAEGRLIGKSICSHFGSYDRACFGDLKSLLGRSTICIFAALDEVTVERNARIAALEEESAEWHSEESNEEKRKADVARALASKKASITSSFSRPVTVLKYLHKNPNTEVFENCTGLSDMVAVVRSSKKPGGTMYRPLTAEGFASWLKSVPRIVDLREWDKKRADEDKQAGQLARMEKAIKTLLDQAVKVQAKVGGAFSIPVLEMQALVEVPLKGRGKVRLIKAERKAA